MKSKILLLAAALMALPAAAENDFGLWSNIAIQKEVTKKISFNGEIELRANNKVGEISRYGLSAGMTFKPVSFLNIGASYSFIRDHNRHEMKDHFEKNSEGELELENGMPVLDGYNHYDSFWRNKHRLSLDATGKVKFGRFSLSLRERYQYTRYAEVDVDRQKYRFLPEGFPPSAATGPIVNINGHDTYLAESDVKTKKAKNSHMLRSRLKLEYNIKGLPLNPYASYEFTNDLEDKLKLDKTRLIVGTEIKITKKHNLDIAYLLQDYQQDHDKLHAISVGYKFKF